MEALIIITLVFCVFFSVIFLMFRKKIRNFFTTNIKNISKRIQHINWEYVVIALILTFVLVAIFIVLLSILIWATPALVLFFLVYFILAKIIAPIFNFIFVLKNKIKFIPKAT